MSLRISRTTRSPHNCEAASDGRRVPRSGTVYPSDFNADSKGNIVVPPGQAWVEGVENGTIRSIPLRRAFLNASAAVGSSQVQVKAGSTVLFLVGQQLDVVFPMAVIELDGTWDGNELVTVEVDGKAVDLPAAAGVTAAAAALTGGINGSVLNRSVRAIAGTNAILLLGKALGEKLPVTVTVGSLGAPAPAGTGTASIAGGGTELSEMTLGTVQAVDHETGNITLDTPLVSALPAGVEVGVADFREVKGLTTQEFDPINDFVDVGFLTAGTLHLRKIYWDSDLASQFPEIRQGG